MPGGWEGIAKMKKPLIAAVNGFALGNIRKSINNFYITNFPILLGVRLIAAQYRRGRR